MTDTPRSDYHSRFSTPVSELDDHRNQPETLPRADAARHGSRRGTLASVVNERPEFAPAQLVQMLGPGMIARDFEQAIVDDDQSMRSKKSGASRRRGSHSPMMPRRSIYRRPQQENLGQRSRDSSRSRSTSPPNSVDAFAVPQRRRGRAGTLGSNPSLTNISVQRTVSNDGQNPRRPTFSDIRSPEIRGNEKDSRRSSVENDVCFPLLDDEGTKTYTIDFEELEEFVAESHKKTPVAHPFTTPAAKVNEPKVFHNLNAPCSNAFTTCDSGAYESEVTDEKLGVDDPTRTGSVQEGLENDTIRPAVDTSNVNRWTFFSSEIDETIHAPELGGLLMPGERFRDLFELGPDGGLWWLDMLNPSEEEVVAVCKAFGVHPLTREDITTQETREKVELFRSYYFVCFRSFYQEDKTSVDFMEPINVYAVVFREGLLTFSFCPNAHAANVRKRIGRLRDYVNLSADWICYALM